jgi:hypothetical protein
MRVRGVVECRRVKRVKLIKREDRMDQATGQRASQAGEAPGSTASPACGKERWNEPKLAFIAPKLIKHGRLEEVTAGFFGSFIP